MKRVFLFLMVAVSAFWSSAQGFKFGVEAGSVLSHPLNSTGTQVGFSVGGRVEYSFRDTQKGLFLSSGLGLISKPAKGDNGDWVSSKSIGGQFTAPYSATPYYLQVPVHVGYRFKFSDSFQLHAETGPYAAVLLFGNGKIDMTDFSVGEVVKLKCAGDMYRRCDFGWSAGIGGTIKDHWQVGLTYGFEIFGKGFMPYGDNYNQTYNLTLGYRF